MEQKNTFFHFHDQDSAILNYAESEPVIIDINPNDLICIQEKEVTNHINLHKTKRIKNTSVKIPQNKKKRKIEMLEHKIRELEKEIQILKSKNFCDKCGSKHNLDNPINQKKEEIFAQPKQTPKQSEASFADLQFERFQITQRFITPIEQDPINLDGRAWIFTGMVMLLMGININGFDGTIDVYKITKQTVDHIRKQVEKSNENINFPIYYQKIFSEQGSLGITNEISREGFELQGLRIQSIDESEWNFEEQLNFNLKYQALIVMMEYMKQYASFK